MATIYPRLQVTPNEALLSALRHAELRWPDASRGELVVLLALAGDRALSEQEEAARDARRAAIAELRALTDQLYDPGELESLREDWPA